MPHPLLVIYILGYVLLHSLLASLPVKAWVQHTLGDQVNRWYRLGYNVVAVVLLLPLPVVLALLPDQVLYVVPAPWRWLMLAGQGVALLGLLATTRQTDTSYFLGFSQLREQPAAANTGNPADHPVDHSGNHSPDPSVGDDTLVTDGLYGYVRHPMYAFSILLVWLSPAMSSNLLAVILLLSLYMYIGSFHEEHRLIQVFGDQYRAYQQRVPRLLPRLRLPFGRGRKTMG